MFEEELPPHIAQRLKDLEKERPGEQVSVEKVEGKNFTGYNIVVGTPTEYHIKQALKLIKVMAEAQLRDQAAKDDLSKAG